MKEDSIVVALDAGKAFLLWRAFGVQATFHVKSRANVVC